MTILILLLLPHLANSGRILDYIRAYFKNQFEALHNQLEVLGSL